MEYLSDQQSEEGAWTMTKNRKDAKKQKASDQVRRSTRNKKTVVLKEQPAPGGLSGVNQTIGERLAQIGLKHASVSQGGNCAYLATSQAVNGSSSKWQTVRNLRARHLEGNKEHYIGGLTSEMLEETIEKMKAAGQHIDELGLKDIEDLYERNVEIWMRN